jgi:lipoate-protein ligase A
MEEKVPGGKLARLTIKTNGSPRVVLSGDFFIYPEEGIFIIEDVLSGLEGCEPLEAVESALRVAIRNSGLELIGLDEHVIARLYKGAVLVEDHRA